ncbi:MAG TPA: GntR family transcriptional regulator [Casimicrobiaceae bacterium]|nr:GntR family transcriptional regulator [Casimicrobiaceae bacterium]
MVPSIHAPRTASRRGPRAPAFRPLYLQIRDLMVERLDAGEWRPGEAIPSELELAARYRVSHGTARKAIDALAADNLLIRRQGKGTFVATHTEERSSMFRFLRIRRSDGREEYPASRLIDVRRSKATAEVARALEIKSGDSVFVLRRLLEYEGEPAVLDEIILPATLFKGMTRARVQAYRGSMYSLFETQFGVRIVKAQEKLRAVAADAATGALLDVEPGQPLLAVERITRTYGDRPVEWRRGLCSTRRHHYVNDLG